MLFLIDGYNLLFRLDKRAKTLEKQREKLLSLISCECEMAGIHAVVVFDGEDPCRPFASKSDFGPLEVVYTHSGQTADEYIIEALSCSSYTMPYIVTSDSGLKRQCSSLGAKTLTVEEFGSFLLKRREKIRRQAPEKPLNDPQLERLRKIFEERLDH